MELKKFTFLILLCCITSAALFAQKPQEILGVAKETHPASYYKEQSKLWQQEIAKKPDYNYAYWQWYKAERSYLIKKNEGIWPDNKEQIFKQLDPIVATAKKEIGQSFDYYFMAHANTFDKGSGAATLLEKAYKADPDRKEAYESLLIHYVTVFDEKGAAEVSKKMLEQNYFSNANLKWNYNALQTASENGVFISQGDMDGIPRWVLQYGEGIRDDVSVVSKWMLAFDDYRKTVFKKLGVPPFGKSKSDFNGQTEYVDALAVHLMKNTKQKSYIGCGTPVSFFEKHGLADNVYLVGTAFVYSKDRVDNMSLTKQNFEQNYDLEYLFHNFQSHHEDNMVKTWMNITYIPGLMKMKDHYESQNDKGRANYYANLIEKIATESGRKAEIMSWY